MEEAKEFHGDLCAGIALGTRMSVLGAAIGIEDPKGEGQEEPHRLCGDGQVRRVMRFCR